MQPRTHDAAVEPGVWSQVVGFEHDVGWLLATIREQLKAIAEPPRKVRRAMRWVDEYLSRSAEYVLAALSTELEEAEAPARVREKIRDAAVEEARYRGGQQFGPTLTLDATDEQMEEIEYRHHMSKRFTSSVLWLRTEVRDAQRWALHALYAVSAGVAMAFAVSAAVIYGNPADPQRVWIWGLVMVVAICSRIGSRRGCRSSLRTASRAGPGLSPVVETYSLNPRRASCLRADRRRRSS